MNLFLHHQLRGWRVRWRLEDIKFRSSCDVDNFAFKLIVHCSGRLQTQSCGTYIVISSDYLPPSPPPLPIWQSFLSPSLTSQLTSAGFLPEGWLVVDWWLHTRITASSVTQNWWKWGEIFVSCPPSGNNTLLMGKVRVNWADYNLQGTVSRLDDTWAKAPLLCG